MIAPDEYELAEDEWENVRRLMRAVKRREFTSDDPATLRARFLDGRLSDDACEDAVQRALELVSETKWERATDLLVETFAEKSVCAERVPELESPPTDRETDRRVSCHLHNRPDGPRRRDAQASDTGM